MCVARVHTRDKEIKEREDKRNLDMEETCC